MARRCSLTGKGVMTGNNVSHAHNKTRRRYLPNLQNRRLYSETLGMTVRVRIAANTLRTIEKRGGIDGFLRDAKSMDLPTDMRRLKRRIEAQDSGGADGKVATPEMISVGQVAATVDTTDDAS